MPHHCNSFACRGGARFSLPTPACGRISSHSPRERIDRTHPRTSQAASAATAGDAALNFSSEPPVVSNSATSGSCGTRKTCRNAAPMEPACPASHWLSTRSALRSEEHTSELQSLRHLVCRLLLEKKKNAI